MILTYEGKKGVGGTCDGTEILNSNLEIINYERSPQHMRDNDASHTPCPTLVPN